MEVEQSLLIQLFHSSTNKMEEWWHSSERSVQGRAGVGYFQWRTQDFFSGGGVQQIQLRTEDREEGDLGAVAP